MKKAIYKPNCPHRHGYPEYGERAGQTVTILFGPGQDPDNPKLRLYQVQFDDGVKMCSFTHELIDRYDDAPIIYSGTLAQLAGILAAAKSIEIRCENPDGSHSICIINPATQAITPTL